MKRQRGVTLTGFIAWAAVAMVVVIVGTKMLPSYIEYWRVQSILGKLAKSPELRGGSINDIRVAFVKQTMVEDVKAIGANDLREMPVFRVQDSCRRRLSGGVQI